MNPRIGPRRAHADNNCGPLRPLSAIGGASATLMMSRACFTAALINRTDIRLQPVAWGRFSSIAQLTCGRSPYMLLGARLGDQWKCSGITDGCNGQVNVEIRPVKSMLRGPLNVSKLADCCVPKPREVRERKKQFFRTKQQPKAVRRNVQHFNSRSAFSKRCGFHRRVPRPVAAPHELAAQSGHNCGLERWPAQAKTWLPRPDTLHERAFAALRVRRSKTESCRRERLWDSPEPHRKGQF